MKKILSLIMVTLVVIFGLLKANPARAANDTAEVTLYHMLNQNTVAKTLNANDQIPGHNAEFEVYDLTKYYLEYLKTGQDAASLNQEMSLMEEAEMQAFIAEHALVKLHSTRTDHQGQATFELANHTLHAYLIIQKTAAGDANNPLEEAQKALPLVLVTPVYDENGQIAATYNLYTKAVLTRKSPYFLKYGVDQDEQVHPMKDVQFGIIRLHDGKEEFLTTDYEFTTSANPLADDDILKVSSDQNGLVIYPQLKLAEGTYYFKELATNAGYVISEAAQRIKIVVKKGQPVTINGVELKNLINNNVHTNEINNEDLIVYNYFKGVETDDDEVVKGMENEVDDGEVVKSLQSSWLPQTGEEIMLTSLLGFIIVLLSLYLIKNRKNN